MSTGNISERPVAILGGGAIAQTQAADFALEGYKVRLYDIPEFAPKSLGVVLETRRIELEGVQSNLRNFTRSGIAKLEMVTSNICERDFFSEGRSLDKMGLDGMSQEQMVRYLRQGVKERCT